MLTASLQAMVAPASAQDIGHDDAKVLALPEQSIWSKLYHNYLGVPRQHIWFVIADSAATFREASQKLPAVNKMSGGVTAEVYKPAGNARGYFIVVGHPMKVDEARALVEKLNQATGAKRARAWSPLKRD